MIMADSRITVESVSNPEGLTPYTEQLQRARLNRDWLEAHWSELLPVARGKFLAVAGQRAFVADTPEEAWKMAGDAFPSDDGAFVQYVRSLEGPRFYANQG